MQSHEPLVYQGLVRVSMAPGRSVMGVDHIHHGSHVCCTYGSMGMLDQYRPRKDFEIVVRQASM